MAPEQYGGFSLVNATIDGAGNRNFFYRNGDREFKAFVRSRGQDHSGGKSKLIEFDPADEIIAEFNRAGIMESSLPVASVDDTLPPHEWKYFEGGHTYFRDEDGKLCVQVDPVAVEAEEPTEVKESAPVVTDGQEEAKS